MIFNFLSESYEINFGRLIRILIEDIPGIPYLNHIETILQNNKNININDAEMVTGGTALHALVKHLQNSRLTEADNVPNDLIKKIGEHILNDNEADMVNDPSSSTKTRGLN